MKNVPFSIRLIIMLIYQGTVAALSLFPLKDLPDVPLFPQEDKLIHMSMYLGMALVLLWGFKFKTFNRWYIYGFIVAWGFTMEVIQLVMHVGRHFSMLDMLANITGAFLGVILFRYLDKKSFEKA
ncbi:MAG TPA: VanZ family protein [Sunxiuqinia sp.]|nr:VanZ family protein [Sunxiuqinia sp.]